MQQKIYTIKCRSFVNKEEHSSGTFYFISEELALTVFRQKYEKIKNSEDCVILSFREDSRLDILDFIDEDEYMDCIEVGEWFPIAISFEDHAELSDILIVKDSTGKRINGL